MLVTDHHSFRPFFSKTFPFTLPYSQTAHLLRLHLLNCLGGHETEVPLYYMYLQLFAVFCQICCYGHLDTAQFDVLTIASHQLVSPSICSFVVHTATDTGLTVIHTIMMCLSLHINKCVNNISDSQACGYALRNTHTICITELLPVSDIQADSS